MVNAKRKGDDNERNAEEVYQRAGYKTEKCRGTRWGRTDWFGLFDVMALHPVRKPRLCQVKSNRAVGIYSWVRQATALVPSEHVELDFMVRHDRKGWRLLKPYEDTYRTVYDERKHDCKMGEGLTEYLRGD